MEKRSMKVFSLAKKLADYDKEVVITVGGYYQDRR
jgi:hypothetical protein